MPAQPTFPEVERERVERLCRKLWPDNEVRKAALRALNGTPVFDRDIRDLLRRLANPSAGRWRERQLTAWVLGRVPLHADQKLGVCQALSQVLANDLPYDRGRIERMALRWFTGVGAAIWFISLVNPLLGHSVVKVSLILIALLASFFGVPVFSLVADDRCVDRVRAEAARSLGELRMVESIDALAAAALAPDPICNVVIPLLMGTLPLLTPEHYGQFKRATVPALCQFIQGSESEEYMLTALDALEKIGDGRAVIYVKRLLEESHTGQVRTRAQEILPILLKRQREEQESSVLLRGASQPSTTGGELLRAAQADTETSPELLLRATDATETFSSQDSVRQN